jgi:hypothetical protein
VQDHKVSERSVGSRHSLYALMLNGVRLPCHRGSQSQACVQVPKHQTLPDSKSVHSENVAGNCLSTATPPPG